MTTTVLSTRDVLTGNLCLHIFIINFNWAYARWHTKYTNIHSTVQYIYISTIQVHEHYETQETKNAEKTQKIHEKHIYGKNTKKYEENTENTNILPGKEPETSSL
jgi:hypothetical protein